MTTCYGSLCGFLSSREGHVDAGAEVAGARLYDDAETVPNMLDSSARIMRGA